MPKRRRACIEDPLHVQLNSFQAWANSFKKVAKWLAQYDLEQLLDDNDGIVQLTDFLPAKVAEGALNVLQEISESAWRATDAEEDAAHNNITHSFASTKDVTASEGLEELFRVIQMLLPDELNSFSAARYSQGHHIDAHDDRAYTDVLMEDGQVVQCSRTIAVIYYLTKDWTEEMGGLLRDCVTDKVFVPQFNSLIAFRVPRYHQVTPVTSSHPRLSVFGWFLQEGQLYDLYKGNDQPSVHQVHTETLIKTS